MSMHTSTLIQFPLVQPYPGQTSSRIARCFWCADEKIYSTRTYGYMYNGL
eukprot:COSAG01_NODE_832_length_13250_cov_23.422828_9_plen_50_part_00